MNLEDVRKSAEQLVGRPAVSPIRDDPYTAAKRKAYEFLDSIHGQASAAVDRGVKSAGQMIKQTASDTWTTVLKKLPTGESQPIVIRWATPTPFQAQAKEPTGQVKGAQAPKQPTPTAEPDQKIATRAANRSDVRFSSDQLKYAQQVRSDAQKYGANPDVLEAIANNESSLRPTTTPNINARETSYGPFQINLKAHPEITKEQASDYNFAVKWASDRINNAARIFPDSIEQQILYYNVPGNAYADPSEVSYQGAWYLANALKHIGIQPSEEYLPMLQKYKLWQ